MTDERLAATRSFTYDSINRLTASTGGPSGSISYSLDGVGNREEVTGGAHAGEYTMSSSTPNPADFQMNQYTTAPFGGLASVSRTYDLNGNATLIPFQEDGETTPVLATATYDYRNLMVKYQRTGMTADYKYDALGRRIETTLTDGEDTTTTLFLHRGDREIEERDGEETILATYVHGNGIDEVLNMRRDGQDFFYHADEQGTVWAVTDGTGAVAERYNYENYGQTYVIDPSGDPLAGSAIGNPSRYTGRRYDPESGLYWYRTRYYDPAAGRFVSRDSIGIWGDSISLGNGKTALGQNPWSWTDPDGTRSLFRRRAKAGGLLGALGGVGLKLYLEYCQYRATQPTKAAGNNAACQLAAGTAQTNLTILQIDTDLAGPGYEQCQQLLERAQRHNSNSCTLLDEAKVACAKVGLDVQTP